MLILMTFSYNNNICQTINICISCRGIVSCLPIISVSTLLTLVYCMGGKPSCSQNMAAAVPAAVVNASSKHTASVIFLHGLGDTGHGWSQGFADIRQPHIKYICPHAPTQKVTLNMGMEMPSWFDIKRLAMDGPEDETGIKASAKLCHQYIQEEIKLGIKPERIIVGGFSQGGAVALYTALTREPNYAGIVALSTWLPLHKTLTSEVVVSNKDTPIMQCHGEDDTLLSPFIGDMTSQALRQLNSKSSFKKYAGMGHSSSMQEMQDVKEFISCHLPPV